MSKENYDKELEELKENIASIKNKIVVISGKGGVGKSSIATNLAAYAASLNKYTGLLDVDVHGPSIPRMLGLENKRIQMYEENKLMPIAYNNYLKVISIGFFLNDISEAVIWRGPRKHALMKQFLKDVQWGELDYLIVDCPPGTGDEPLGIVQLLKKVDGAVVVTTPQEVSLNDVRKSITFCNELKVPVLGIVENMSGFVCPECKTKIDIFKAGGGEKLAAEMKVPYVGSISIYPEIVKKGDDGQILFENIENNMLKGELESCFSKIIER